MISISAVAQHTRYLHIANISNDALHLYVQYYTQDETGKWGWSPGDRRRPKAEPLSVQLAKGEAADVLDNGSRVNASKVPHLGPAQR